MCSGGFARARVDDEWLTKGDTKMERTRTTDRAKSWSRRDSGQVTIFVAIALGTFLLGFVGFGADMTNLWFHRQSAQNAADAACLAGAMDMLSDQQCTGCTPYGGFTPGAAFDCASASTSAPCQYAAKNGYSGAGLASGAESNQVSASFPASVPGVTKPTVAMAGAFPFLQVDIVDRVRVYFSALVRGSPTQDVRAIAKCGLVASNTSVPIVVLNPTCQHPFEVGGSATVAILGGPPRSIQVNSSNQTCAAATTSTGSGCTSTSNLAIDLHQGGPNFTGSDFGVFGAPAGSAAPPSPSVFNPGTTGSWVSPASPIPDPYRNLPAPSTAGLAVDPPPTFLTYNGGTNGCPYKYSDNRPSKLTPGTCVVYYPGVYNSAIQIASQVAIFNPGIYYIKGIAPANKSVPGAGCVTPTTGTGNYGLTIGSNGIVRPNTAVTGNDNGTMFYFSGTGPGAYGSVFVGSSAGTPGARDTIDSLSSSAVKCPGTGVDPDRALPPTFDGNVLLGPCTGTYGDSSGLGQYRGMLFFDDRANADNTGQPSMQGGGGLLLGGTLYFHNCPNSPTCAAPPTDYNAFFDLQGSPGSTTYVYGNIITDELVLAGSATINMQLNKNQLVNVVKVALLQ
ncbi:MAG: hypothetical protein DMG25_16940 [Acidobacteria bacterium]|nr:MAG: hypothetical protein DMG25_16940 [Acidobacteriota bacterium]